MDASSITLSIISSGLVATSLTQITKQYIPEKFRTIFALGMSVVVGLAGALLAWALAGEFTVEALTVQLLAVVGTSQAIYAAIAKTVPGSDAELDVEGLTNTITDLVKRVDEIAETTNDNTAIPKGQDEKSDS